MKTPTLLSVILITVHDINGMSDNNLLAYVKYILKQFTDISWAIKILFLEMPTSRILPFLPLDRYLGNIIRQLHVIIFAC